MKIDIDIDDFIGPALLDAMEMTYTDITDLKKQEELQDYQVEDLEYNLRLLPALKTVYKYYTVHSEYYKLDEYDIIDYNESTVLEDG